MKSDHFLTQATELLQSNQIDAARDLLKEAIKADQQNIQAWIKYIETLPTNAERVQALQWCLQFNPNNQVIKEALARLQTLSSPEATLSQPESNLRKTVSEKPVEKKGKWKPASKMLFLTPILILIGIYGIGRAIFRFTDEQALQREGIIVQANVIDSNIVKGGYYSVDYTFEIDGQTYSTYDQFVEGRDWKRIRENSEVEVIYLPSNPNVNRIVVPDGEDKSLDKLGQDVCIYTVVLLIGLVLLVGIVAAWKGLADPSKSSN